jgi:phage RecT family recombinase
MMATNEPNLPGNRVPPAPPAKVAPQKRKPKMDVIPYLKQYENQLSAYIPDGIKDFNFALLLDQLDHQMKDPKRGKALGDCTNESIGAAIKNCCVLGLLPGYGADTAEIYFIPYAGVCTTQISYKGLETMIWRTGAYRRIVAHALWDSDEFEWWDGSDEGTGYRYKRGKEKKTLTGAFAMIETQEGVRYVEEMNSDEINNIEETTRKGGKRTPAWELWPDRMYRKTVLRALFKKLPKASSHPLLEKAQVIEIENANMVAEASKPAALVEGMK